MGTIVLTHDDRTLSESQGPGMPNYLTAPVTSFDGQFAYVPSKKDHISAGALRQVFGITFDHTVRANTSRIALSTSSEDTTLRIDLDNASVASGAALSGDDRYLFVALETSRELAVYDLQSGFELMRLPTGRAPQSVALSSDGSRAYVHNFMDRSVSRFDLTEMLQTHLPVTNLLAPIDVVGSEALAADVLLGKQHFYDAADDRIARDNYLSCASCHNDGGHDGRVWDFGNAGEGLRRTPGLRGHGTAHGMVHWSGNFDEVQDFENQLRALNLGTGFLTAAQFAATGDPLGSPKTGLSADLDAIAAYLAFLNDVPESPHRPSAASLSAAAQQGRSLFASVGCLGCHAMPALTDSSFGFRHDIGTIDAASGERLNAPLDGFDTPGLLGAWLESPYLHDGDAMTLEDAITAHGAFASLPAQDVSDMATFLREAEPADLVGFNDADSDGTVDLNDPQPSDPCVPTVFVGACSADTDGDGFTDFEEGEGVDTDGDGLFDWEEHATADHDFDGVPDQNDPGNLNRCTPDPALCAMPVPSLGLRALGLLVVSLLGVALWAAPRARRMGR